MYTRLLDAATALSVASPVAYRAWHQRSLHDAAMVHESSVVLVARIDHGRWIVDCLCGAGVYTHPEWRLACCVDCGAIYHDIVMPSAPAIAALTRLLLARARRENQHWSPGESLDRLKAENLAHNVGV